MGEVELMLTDGASDAEASPAALRRRVEQLRTVFGAMDMAYCTIAMVYAEDGRPIDYRFLEVNEAFLTHTGLREPVGKTIRQLVPDHDEHWFQLYGKVAETGEPARLEQRAEAMGRWFDVVATRIGDPAARTVALLFTDVSKARVLQAERASLLAREQAARAEAETANRLKDLFLATVSHELRTPLTAILGYTVLLRAGRLAPERVDRALETIDRSARAQAQLIEDLLDVSRMLEGKLRLERAPTDLATVIEAAVETVRPAADTRGVRLEVSTVKGATVSGDPHRLQQIVWNLLSNAVKFTPKGGSVFLALELEPDDAASITVMDSGVGISADFLPHVFERFRQADGASTQKAGIGLGLSIVRHLVELHDGTIDASSAGVGRGASFCVRLPLVDELSRASQPPIAPVHPGISFEAAPDLGGAAVLVVDDEPDSLELVRGLLESCGAQVRTARSVEEALASFSNAPPDVLVSDIGLPGDDGIALIGRVRALPRADGGATPAVALTAHARPGDRTRSLLAGFDTHVTKPAEPLELVAVVAALAKRIPRAK